MSCFHLVGSLSVEAMTVCAVCLKAWWCICHAFIFSIRSSFLKTKMKHLYICMKHLCIYMKHLCIYMKHLLKTKWSISIPFSVLVMKYLYFFLLVMLSHFLSCDNCIAGLYFTVKKVIRNIFIYWTCSQHQNFVAENPLAKFCARPKLNRSQGAVRKTRHQHYGVKIKEAKHQSVYCMCLLLDTQAWRTGYTSLDGWLSLLKKHSRTHSRGTH